MYNVLQNETSQIYADGTLSLQCQWPGVSRCMSLLATVIWECMHGIRKQKD